MNTLSAPKAALLAGVLLAAPAAAQRSDHQVRADLEFAKELASRYTYIDMADSVIERLERESLSPELGVELGLAKCDIYAEGAKNEVNAERRIELYDKAIAAYRDFIRGNPFSELLPEAERSYVDIANNYGRAMERQLDELLGEERQRQVEKIKDVLEDALQLTGDLVDQLEATSVADRTEAEQRELNRLRLNRAQMLLTMGETSQQGVFFFSQAEQTLEKLALEVGERTFGGLNAYLVLTKVKLAQGEYEDARNFAEFVVSTAIPTSAEARDEEDWGNIPIEIKSKRWQLAELAMSDLLEAESGIGTEDATAAASTWALHFYNSWKREGFTVSPFGYLSMLASARALMNSGGYIVGQLNSGELRWVDSEDAIPADSRNGRSSRTALDLALSIAQTVNQENRGSILQVYAQKLISDIINRPGISVSPDVLYEAAQGEYNAREYVTAIGSFKSILRALDTKDEATRNLYVPKVLLFIGRALLRLDRTLEGAMALREAAVAWPKDEEYAPEIAQNYYGAMRVLRSRASGDREIERMYLEAEGLVQRWAASEVDAGDIVFRQAERLYGQSDFAAARAKYLEVPQQSNTYEKARVKAAFCLYKERDYDGARQEFAEYVDNYVGDPTNKVNEAAKVKNRQEAMAMATFYRGRIAFIRDDWANVVAVLDGFDARFPDQTDYGPNALYMVMTTHLQQGDVGQARATFEHLHERFPRDDVVGRAAFELYKILKAELDKAAQAGEGGRTSELTREIVGYLKISNEVGGTPSYGNLRAESLLWIDLGEWEEAETVLRRILQLFEGDRDLQKDLEAYILPDLGLCLLEQKRVPDAFEILAPLVPDPTDRSDARKPSAAVVTNWCRAVAGWVEGDASGVVEVPGVGGEENLDAACRYLIRLTNLAESWTCPWLELKFQTAYAYYRWGQLDSKRIETARGVLRDIRQFADAEYRLAAERCGNDVLQRRFQWLESKLQ